TARRSTAPTAAAQTTSQRPPATSQTAPAPSAPAGRKRSRSRAGRGSFGRGQCFDHIFAEDDELRRVRIGNRLVFEEHHVTHFVPDWMLHLVGGLGSFSARSRAAGGWFGRRRRLRLAR